MAIEEEVDTDLEALIAEMEAEKDEEDEGEEEQDNDEEETDDEAEEENEDEENADDDESEQDESTGDEDESDDDGEGEDDDAENATDFEPITLNVNGIDVTVDNLEDLVAYAKAGAKASVKEETLVEEKSIVEQGKLSAEDLKLYIDAKNGSKEAIAKIAENAKIDLLDVDPKTASEYKAEFQPTSVSEIDKVANEIASDKEHLGEFQKVAGVLPQDFTQLLKTNAAVLRDFSGHVKKGIAQEIIPKALTEQIKNGGTFMDAYTKVGTEIMQKKQGQGNEQVKSERQVDKRAQTLREKATKKKSTKSEKADSAKDVWELSDKEFDEALARGDFNS